MIKQKKLFLEVEPYNRNSYLVHSATRPEITHLVDLEGDGEDKVVCTCESFILGNVKSCEHIKSVMLYQNEVSILCDLQTGKPVRTRMVKRT